MNKTIPAILLVYSVIKFRRQSKAMDLQEYFGTEKLMSLHLIIFIASILCFFSGCYAYRLINQCNEIGCDLETLCTRVSTWKIIHSIDIYLTSALIILFTYLSVKFSKPLNDYQT